MFFLRWLTRLGILAFIVAIAAAAFVFFDYKRFLQTPVVTASSTPSISVKPGETMTSLTHSFGKYNITLASQSPLSQYVGNYYFRYLAKSTGKANKLKVGEYKLTKGMKPQELLDVLISGKGVAYEVKFLEGWNFKQLMSTLKKQKHIDNTLADLSSTDILKKITSDYDDPEGLFFPDTYHFPNNSTDLEVLKASYALMQQNLATAWAARDAKTFLKTPYELLILASLIEKETAVDSERSQVSGVFHRRIAKGMPLQTDPTVIYGMGDKYKGTIYRSDLKRDTPYNTYTRKGLPPTPIAMPGLASLMAAGQPDSGKSLYFVANGSGGHTFSNTYAQHKKAVRAYRKQQRKKP